MPSVSVRNKFMYPSGVAPRFDPTHLAAPSIIMSAVSQGANFYDLITGKLGSVTNVAPTADVYSNFGPHVKFVGGGAIQMPNHRVYTAGNAPLTTTMACIGTLDSQTNQQSFMSMGTAGVDSGYPWIGNAAALNNLFAVAIQGQTPVSSGSFSLALGTPFFFAASSILSNNSVSAIHTANMVAVNLLSGQVLSFTGVQNPSAGNGSRNGNYMIGGRSGSSNPLTGRIAAAMASDAYLSLGQLLQWAQDPWGFWYPQREVRRVVLTPITTVAARVPLVRNKLVFPAGVTARFDPTHPLAASCQVSGVASGGSFVNLFAGAPRALVVGGPSFALTSIGPVGVGGLNAGFKFSGQPAAIEPDITMGAICYFSSLLSATQVILVTDSTGSGCNLSLNTSNQLGIVYSAVNRISSTFVPVVNTPYLLLASRNQTTANFAVVNLLNGKIDSSTVGGGTSTPATSNGQFSIGGVSGLGFAGGVAAAFYASRFNSLQTLLSAAQAPWAFWYPRSLQSVVVPSAVGIKGVKVWSGSAWAVKPAKVWTGSAWTQKPVKTWNGSAWV